eukprot:11717674-Karenia_brevis.AAC.1
MRHTVGLPYACGSSRHFQSASSPLQWRLPDASQQVQKRSLHRPWKQIPLSLTDGSVRQRQRLR